jgi:2-keto-4-pentenoate hydratase/2-oxohepta-3-ene-1,7-dioic acid hydratase in catechol pathway
MNIAPSRTCLPTAFFEEKTKMRICRFDNDRLGVVEGDQILDVTEATHVLPKICWPFPNHDLLIANWTDVKPEIERLMASAARKPLAQAHLLSPVANPNKIIGMAGNRKNRDSDVIDFGAGVELNNTRREADPPRMFLKANSAMCGCSDGIALRFLDRRTDPEAEFTYVIGKQGTDIPPEKVMDHVFGYMIGIDMSLRGSEPPSTRKSIDSYAMVGPWIVTPDELPDPDNVPFTLTVNGELRQKSNTNNMEFGIVSIISHLSKFFTLYPGDIIMAGSPLGFDPVRPGDKLVAEFEHIGKMPFTIRAH